LRRDETVVWRPDWERLDRTSRGLLNRLDCGSYAELHRLSVADPERFGPELVADLGLEFS